MHAVSPVSLYRVIDEQISEALPDLVAVEEPLEIRIGYGSPVDRQQMSIAVTMRTPTHDFDLALGFLYTEGVINSLNQVVSIQYCVDIGKQTTNNIIRVELQPTVEINTKDIHRNFYMTSSCGICGKASIEAIKQRCEPSLVTLETINGLNEALKRHQHVFEYTGGLHAAALYSEKGDILLVREDVGRHNALDKLIGNALTQTILPLSNTILLMSSRASFELIQKAVMAGISVIATIGAPSSLAIDTANTFGVTLLGFVRNQQFNIYTGKQRIMIN